jgi:hypothetical protein
MAKQEMPLCPLKQGTVSLEEILYNTVQHTNQHIPIIHPNFSHERDAKLR